jgi:hypothetical protein
MYYKSLDHNGSGSFRKGCDVNGVIMTEQLKSIDVLALAKSAMRSNRSFGGGRGRSTDPSQIDVLGFDGLQFIQKAMKGNSVSTTDFLAIGAEFFRKENIDWTLSKKAQSAKTFSKVTVTDIELKFIDDEVLRLSEILSTMTEDQAVAQISKLSGFGQVFITNEQYKCEWPLGEVVNSREGDPVATDLAPIVAPWSLLEEALEKFASN